MRLLRDILVCVVLVALAAFLIRGAMLFQSAEKLTDSAAKAASGVDLMRVTLQAQLTGKNGVVEELRQVLLQSRKTIDVLQKTSLAERAKVAAFSDASIQVVNHLDATVRSGTVAVQGMQEAIARLGGVAVALQSDAEAARPVLEGATVLVSTLNSGTGQALDKVNLAIGDFDERVRAVKPIEDHVETATKSIAETLGFIQDDFTPRKKSFWLKVADAATSGMFSVFLHWLPQRVREVH